MKRISVLVLAVMLVLGLNACGKADEERKSKAKGDGLDYFNAIILEEYDEYLIVECLDVTSGYVYEGEKVEVSKDVLEKGIPELAVGDNIRVLFYGLEETTPIKLKSVFGIYPINNRGEVVVNFEPETEPPIHIDADINMYNYYAAEGIVVENEKIGCSARFSFTSKDNVIEGTITVKGYTYVVSSSSLININDVEDKAYVIYAECIKSKDEVIPYDSRIFMQIDDELEAFYLRLGEDECFVGPANNREEAKGLYEKLGLHSVGSE